MRNLIIILLLVFNSIVFSGEVENSHKSVEKRIFVSFSMPTHLIKQIFEEAEHLRVTAVFNGLIDNSMPKTALKLSEITSKYPNLSIQIDPVAFEDYAIDAVPAIVVSSGNTFDVVQGNIALPDALELIHERGDLKGRVL